MLNKTKQFALAALAVLCAAPAWAQAPAAGGLDGIYMGLSESMLSGKMRKDFYTFLPDGRVFRGTPPEGLGRPVEWERLCASRECGTYRRRGGDVQVRWRYAPDKEMAFSLDGGGVLRKRGRSSGYRPVHVLDGFRPAATYGVVDPESGRAVVSLTLGSDGRFREEGLMRYTTWAALGAPGERDRMVVDGGEGSYTIRRGTLELRYDGGPVAHFLVMAPPGVSPGPVPKTIYIIQSSLDRLR